MYQIPPHSNYCQRCKKAEPFYDQLFHLLGFDVQKKYSGYLEHADMEVVEYLSDTFDFGNLFAKARMDQ